MQRLRFRVYDSENDIFIYLAIGGISHDDVSEFDGLAKEGYPVDQFTGVQDTNGKDIHEGDIVKIVSDDLRIDIALVSFVEAEAAFMIVDAENGELYWEGPESYLGLSTEKVEDDYGFGNEIYVIGNIHQKSNYVADELEKLGYVYSWDFVQSFREGQ